MGALVFVTTELSPFTPGGIGRVIHNLLRTMSAEDRQRAIVLLLDRAVPEPAFEALFPGARLVAVDTTEGDGRHDPGGHHPPQWAYGEGAWHWRSAVIYRALREVAAETPIDYVEFVDWAGQGFCTIQEKHLRGFLRDAVLAVRLHSTETMLATEEAQFIGPDVLLIGDIERKCLRDCDRIVGQLASVADATRARFGIASEEWLPRVHIHAPPVLLDTREPVGRSVPARDDQPILFTSKLQRFKRPDLFVRGVCDFLARNPDYTGDALFCAHSFDDAYAESIRKLIPPDLADRFRFLTRLSPPEREALIAESIVVVPSNFESFCLVAYEASRLGARVVLNGRDVAFGDDTPWQDGVNCCKFVGTAADLSRALERCWRDGAPLEAVRVPADPLPWADERPALLRDEPPRPEPLVSVVVALSDHGDMLGETLGNVLEQNYPALELIVVDDASDDAVGRLLLDRLEAGADDRLKIVRLHSRSGVAGAVNAGIRAAKGAYVLPLQPGDRLQRDFVRIGVAALEHGAEFDLVVPQVGSYAAGDFPPLAGERGDAPNYTIYIGEAFLSSILHNVVAPLTSLFRTAVFSRLSYDESLEADQDWCLALALTRAGLRAIVATDAFVHRLIDREPSHAGPSSAYEERMRRHDVLRNGAAAGPDIPIGFLVTCAQAAPSLRLDAATQSEVLALRREVAAIPWRVVGIYRKFRPYIPKKPLRLGAYLIDLHRAAKRGRG